MTCIPLADRPPGEYPLEALPPGWTNAEVTFVRKDGKEKTRFEILDIRSQASVSTRYPQQPLRMIAFKCFGLYLGHLLYFLLYTAIHLIRLPVVTIVNVSPIACAKQIWKLARIPFYFIGLQFAALYAIFRPLEGGALFSDWESQLHDGKSRKSDIRYGNDPPFMKLCWETLSLKENPQTFFMGFCLQPIGRTDDPHLIRVQKVQNPPAV